MKRRDVLIGGTALGCSMLLPAMAGAQVVDLNDAINKAGRQRMAAFNLSACWGVQTSTSAAEMNKARDEFAAAYDLLKKAPEATRISKAELELAETQWNFFDNSLRSLHAGSSDMRAMTEVFTTSERILQVMDSVTAMYSKLS